MSSPSSSITDSGKPRIQRKRRKMWIHYFTLLDDENTAVCKVCKYVLSLNSNKSNLRKHLERKHPDSYNEAKSIAKAIAEGDSLSIEVKETDIQREIEHNIAALKPPIRRRGKKRSVVWNYFTQETPGFVKCAYCGTLLSNSGGCTSQMINHLKLKHSIIHEKATADKPFVLENSFADDTRITTTTVDTASPSPRKKIKMVLDKMDPPLLLTGTAPIGNSGENSLSSPLVKFNSGTSALPFKVCISGKSKVRLNNKPLMKLISVHLLPPSILEIKEFKEMLKAFGCRNELPTKSTFLKTVLPDFAKEVKNKLKSDMISAPNIALTVEMWKYQHSQNCMTVMAHFIGESWNLSSAVVETIDFHEESTSESVITDVRRITDEWGISEKVTSLVSHDSEMLATAAVTMGWKHLFCFGEKLNCVILNALQSVPEITTVIKKANEVAKYFNKSMKASSVLLSVQKQNNFPEKHLKVQVENKWITVYYMIKRMSEQFEAANTVLCYFGKDGMCLCDEDIELIRSVVSVLETFEMVVTEFSSFEYPSMSNVIPLRCVLKGIIGQHDDESTESSSSVSIFRDFLLQQMEAQFANLENKSSLALCTLLDPRFKHHGFTDSIAVKATKEQLLQEMMSIANAKSCSNPDEPTEMKPLEMEEVGKEKRDYKLSSIWDSFEKRVSEAGARQNVNSEVENESSRYFREALISRNQDPLQWWKLNQVQFPHLQVLAKKYLCIPAISMCSSRLFSKKGEKFSDRRNKIKARDLDTLLFLSTNVINM